MLLLRLSVLRHPMGCQRPCRHLLPAFPALDPLLLSFPMHRPLPRHLLSVCRLQLIACRLITRCCLPVTLIHKDLYFWNIFNKISFFDCVECLSIWISMINFEVSACNMESGIMEVVWCHHQISPPLLPQKFPLFLSYNCQHQHLGLTVVFRIRLLGGR